MKEYDVIVVGAGPAGLMAAIVAGGEGLRVLLVERKKDVPKVTRSCCSMWIIEPMTHGECISVEQDRVVFRLNDFCAEDRGERIPLKQYVRFSPGGKKLAFGNECDPVAIAFDKEEFLRGLLRQAEALGVKIAAGTHCVDALDEDDGVSVKLRDPDGEKIEHGSYLIIADGVNSHLGTRLGINKDRAVFGTMQVLSYFFENVECPYPDTFLSFTGTGHLGGGLGSIYIMPKPGMIEGKEHVYEIMIGSPADDAISLRDKMEYFTERGSFAEWFKRAQRIHMNSAVLEFRTPLVTPAKGRTLVAGDAAAFIETYVQGALIYGRSAAKAIIAKIQEGRDFSGYVNHWKNTFGYNQPGEIEKATNAYGINLFSDSELDYFFSFTDNEKHKGYTNEFNDYERIKKAFYRHMDTIRKEKPELAERLEGYLNFEVSSIEESLQLTDTKDNR
jgi:flavin-dependent dehydrogenase